MDIVQKLYRKTPFRTCSTKDVIQNLSNKGHSSERVQPKQNKKAEKETNCPEQEDPWELLFDVVISWTVWDRIFNYDPKQNSISQSVNQSIDPAHSSQTARPHADAVVWKQRSLSGQGQGVMWMSHRVPDDATRNKDTRGGKTIGVTAGEICHWRRTRQGPLAGTAPRIPAELTGMKITLLFF